MKSIIVQIWPEKYEINIENNVTIFSTIKGNLKKYKKISVGDNVLVKKLEDNNYQIIDILERKNSLIRPPVANIDQIIYVVANGRPVPDLLLLDKLLLIATINNIKPIICINKCDIPLNEITEYIKECYTNIGHTVVTSIAKDIKNSNIDSLKELLADKVTILAGGSGVGKSSLIKILFPEHEIEIAEINKKMNRGKHTTKFVRLYSILNGYIADTPGFTAFDMMDNINKNDLKNYYFEYQKSNCKYCNCNHIDENIKDCEIKRKVETNILDKSRYQRYVAIFKELELKEKQKYK